MQRREFFKKSILGAVSLTAIGSLLKSTQAYALELIDMTGKSKNPANKAAMGSAKGLGYIDDLKAALKSGKIKKVSKGGVKPEQQLCSTCNFYKEVKPGQGTCTIIPGVLVKGPGSCNSWIPKPKKS